MVWTILAGVLGLVVGAAINALADDLPARQKPQLPHYPDGTPRPVSAWLGLAAFASGQRRPAGRPDAPALSWRHPVVEVATALLYAAIVAGFPGERSIPTWLIYSAILMLITVIDIEHKLILFVVIVPSCVLAVLISLVAPLHDKPTSTFLLGGLVGFGIFFVMFLGGILFTTATRKNTVAFGFGDVMLATLSGFMIGWQAFLVATVVIVFAGAAGAILYVLLSMVIGRRYKWFTPLPYGPYIVFGTLVLLLFREDVRAFLFNS